MSNLDTEMAEAIVSLTKENESLKNELIKECKEHQEAMQVADERIKELKTQLKTLQEKEKVFSREFAIEQLKGVKEWVINYSDLKGQNWDHTLNYLNNQIKQLKEMK